MLVHQRLADPGPGRDVLHLSEVVTTAAELLQRRLEQLFPPRLGRQPAPGRCWRTNVSRGRPAHTDQCARFPAAVDAAPSRPVNSTLPTFCGSKMSVASSS